MTLVDMDSAYFYQPLKAAGMRKDGRLAASSLRVPIAPGKGNDHMALRPSKQPSGRLQDYELIGILDMTRLTPKESHDPIRQSALDLCIEADAPGTIPYHYFVMDVN